MSERDFDRFSDEEFERFLQDEVSGMNVTEKTVKSVNPWKKSTDMIFAGLILQLFGIGIFYLNYILPLVGSLLVTIGFRMLSNENKWFKSGFVASLLRTTAQVACLILESALISNQSLQTFFSLPWTLINAVLILATVGCLWGGFRCVQKKAGVPIRTKSLGALFFIYLLMPILSLINIYFAFLLILLPAVFIIILVCFRRIIKDISASGYSIYPKAVKFPNWAIVTIFMTVAVVGVLIGNFFFTSYPMAYQPVEVYQDEESVSIKKQLVQMNFPEQFIDDLTEKDLEECTNPVRVVASEREEDGWLEEFYMQYVFVQTEAEKETWKIFCFYNWTKSPKTYRTDCIYIEPIYNKNNQVNWEKVGDISGRVLCEKGGKTYASTYHSLKETVIGQEEEQNPFYPVLDSGVRKSILGQMSFLMGSENCRGYVAYKVQLNSDLDLTKMHIRYGHFYGFVFPYEDIVGNFLKYAEHHEVTFYGSKSS